MKPKDIYETLTSIDSPFQDIYGRNNVTEHKLFPIMNWSHRSQLVRQLDPEEDIKGISECGFTISGFARVDELDLCQKYGLKAMIWDPRLDYDWPGSIDRKKMNENIDSLIEEVGNHPALHCYYLMDEPRPETYMRAYENLATCTKALRERTPDKIAYVNLLPSRGFSTEDEYENYIRKYVETLDAQFLSYDDYALYEDGSLHYSYFKNLEVIRRMSLEYNLPFWHILLSVPHFTYRELSETDMRFQVYTSLAYGAKGISYYKYHTPRRGNYRNGPIDWFGDRTPLWYIMRRVNLQIQTLAPILLELKSIGVYHWPQVPYGCEPFSGQGLVKDIRIKFGVGRFLIGEFKHEDGTPHVMVVNTSFKSSCRFELDFDGDCAIQKADSCNGVGKTVQGNWYLAPGQGMLLKLVR